MTQINCLGGVSSLRCEQSTKDASDTVHSSRLPSLSPIHFAVNNPQNNSTQQQHHPRSSQSWRVIGPSSAWRRAEAGGRAESPDGLQDGGQAIWRNDDRAKTEHQQGKQGANRSGFRLCPGHDANEGTDAGNGQRADGDDQQQPLANYQQRPLPKPKAAPAKKTPK